MGSSSTRERGGAVVGGPPPGDLHFRAWRRDLVVFTTAVNRPGTLFSRRADSTQRRRDAEGAEIFTIVIPG